MTCLFEDPVAIFALSYASFLTVAFISLVSYIIYQKQSSSLRKRTNEVESIDKLNRRSALNRYECNSFVPELRNHSEGINVHKRVISEYDTITCSAKHTCDDLPENEEHFETLLHHYEEVNERKPRLHKFETVLDEAAKALVAVYQDSSSADIYDTFLTILTNKIKARNPQMFQTIRNSGVMHKNQYEEIPEEKPKTGKRCEEIEEEPMYQKYLPIKEEICTGSFGSDEHLKYLVESRNAKNVENDEAYLEAKRFSAASNCPDHLRRLCEAQGSEFNPRATFTVKNQEQVMVVFGTNSSSSKLCASLRSRNERCKKGPPLPPHKPPKQVLQ